MREKKCGKYATISSVRCLSVNISRARPGAERLRPQRALLGCGVFCGTQYARLVQGVEAL